MSRKRPFGLLLVGLSLAALPALAEGLRHFEVEPVFKLSRKGGREGAVAVTFHALDPDLRLNETPAPRLELDWAQLVLVDRQAPPKRDVPAYDPRTAKYVDLSRPVLFPVAVSKSAPAGEHIVAGKVVFFYCSVREAWCRRGTAEVGIPVTVP
jgi:hypothetical protein